MINKYKRWYYKFLNHFKLTHQLEDPNSIYNQISEGVNFKGTNLWILMCSTLVCSVGLNMNSTAVVIGAMLISPLLGPINGIGYSIAVYDIKLFKKSLNNFLFAIITAFLSATLYFIITPISTAQTELLARTSPTIYDVLIALFGGTAGIIAMSTKTKGTVIPGVAIATALMPPLCTAGYGLATLQVSFLFGALYLFTINAVFIALAALLVSKLLKFPIHENAAPARQKVIKRYVTLIIILTLIPSFFLGNRLVQQEKFMDKSKKYIDNVRVIDDKYLLDYSIDPQKKVINLIYGGTTLDEKDKELIASRLQNFDLKAEVVIKQGFAIDQKEYQEKEKLILQISSLEAELNKQNAIIDSIKSRPLLAKNLINELTIINSNIISCAIADTYIFKADNSLDSTTVLLVGIANDDMPKNEKERIISWLKARLQNEKIVVFFSTNLK
ncbi:MAG TPA: TIGR00341 family protein [Bacteroidales bacterium]|nr:TIGR00341 family protein [Bacteroidales bacterium]HON97997.1 TIGR00341 family protein [Bacteroidales bacterium]HOS20753.1 TIGR00341 family protein [Bacteroidales bacterium]HPL03146.1 TIGR00341 family protein [Bacteroidales bacterium]HQE78770.1 TIGR00341 family protein [Bacteroidales bacterium]